MRASIVIPSHNEGDLLRKTVQACLDTRDGLDCEIVVSDDASHDGSIEALQRRFEGVRVVRHDARRGVSATKDHGARQARGEVLLFIDGHCKPEDGALAKLVEAVEEWDGDAVVTPSIPCLDVERWECRRGQVGHGYTIDLASCRVGWIGLERMKTVNGPRGGLYYRQPTMIGCCVAMGRSLYERLLGFDVGMQSYGSEDVDMGLKAWLMGYPVLHAPEAVIGHRFQAGFDRYSVPRPHVRANQFRMVRKHMGDETWSAWIGRFDPPSEDAWWEPAWNAFLEGSVSLEQERDYLMARRKYDEFWFAEEFELDWPRPGDPGAPPPWFTFGPSSSPSPPASPTPPPPLPSPPPGW